MNITNFNVDKEKCIGCGLCSKVCPSEIIYMNGENKAQIVEVKEFGWNGCWKCQHCLAVCPKGAISIFNKIPDNSLLPPNKDEAAPLIDALIANRRTCRRYLDKNVDKKIIEEIMMTLQNVPTGGNKQNVEYILVDDKEQMQILRDILYKGMELNASKGIYPKGFDEKSYNQMKQWEQNVRPDMLFCSAPHILIPHAKIGVGEWVQDVNIACAYFELICASRMLGVTMMTYPLNVLENSPSIKAMLKIPDDHYIGMIIGFGYPEIKYARGVQRQNAEKITMISFK